MLNSMMRCVLPCSYVLIFAVVFTLYLSSIQTWVPLVMLPDNYHEYGVEEKKLFWDTGNRMRARRRSRTILIAPFLFVLGALVVYFFMSFRIIPAS
jgi:hypothetical protein